MPLGEFIGEFFLRAFFESVLYGLIYWIGYALLKVFTFGQMQWAPMGSLVKTKSKKRSRKRSRKGKKKKKASNRSGASGCTAASSGRSSSASSDFWYSSRSI